MHSNAKERSFLVSRSSENPHWDAATPKTSRSLRSGFSRGHAPRPPNEAESTADAGGVIGANEGEIPTSEPPSPAKKLGPIKRYAVWLLGRQEYSEADLGRRFRMKGYPALEIESCLQFLKANGLQSDVRFSANRARVKSVRQGNRRISMDLKTKGIDQDLIAGAVEALGSEDERAIHVARKFAGKALTQELKTKIWRFLASRGFGAGAIKAAVLALQSESGDQSMS